MGAWGIIGSFIYSYQEGDAEPQYIMAEQGTVDITLNGSEYTINAVVTAGGKEYKFRYTGAVTLKDVKDAGDPPAQDYTEVDLGNELTQGYFEFDGDIYKTGGVSNNWLIYLADSRVDFTKQKLVGPGKILMLELNTAPSDGKVLPAGTFNVLNPMEITAAASLTPFTVVPGLAAEDGSIYGTWYMALGILRLTPKVVISSHCVEPRKEQSASRRQVIPIRLISTSLMMTIRFL